MLPKKLFYNRWQTGLLFLLLSLVIPKTFATLILTTPIPGTPYYPYSEMGLWWKYDEDPQVAAEIEKQVEWIGLRLYEIEAPNVYKTPKPSDYVKCRLYEVCGWCGLEYETKFRKPRTFASTAECSKELKPNQWYKWSVWAERTGAFPLAKAATFKTGDYRDIIIDDSSARFIRGGPGPFIETDQGYNNTSLLINTTWKENENNYCQWEWTIPEERTYEILVYIPLKYINGSRIGTSNQAIYKLWREGLPGPDYKSTITIDQTSNVNSLWMSLDTFRFKVGQASLRLNDNTGESAPLGRQLICDAVKVRPRLGTVGKPDAGITASMRRRGTRSSFDPPKLLYPMNRQVIPLSSTGEIKFSWSPIQGTFRYRFQFSEQPFASNSLEEKKFQEECEFCSLKNSFDLSTNSKHFGKTYYWRVRAEKEGFISFFDNIGKWSEVRQFEVIESPTVGGNYPVKCLDLNQTGRNTRINFSPSLEYRDNEISGRIGNISKIPARARICYPDGKNEMPVVLLLHGDNYNCQRCPVEPNDPNNTSPCKQEDKYSYYHWQGKYIIYYDSNKKPKLKQILPASQCDLQRKGENGTIIKIEEVIKSYRGFDYLLKKLASHGIFALSIDTHELQGHNEDWKIDARVEVILKFVAKLKIWNQKGTDPFGGRFKNQLDLKKIGLIGHSRGGEAAIEAAQRLKDDKNNVAISAIAPSMFSFTDRLYTPYYLLQGLRDNDAYAMQPLAHYQTSKNTAEKMKALVYGANHSYFNQEWANKLPDEASGIGGANPMAADEQQEIAQTTVIAFMRWHLLGDKKYQAILNGSYKQARIFWAYHAGESESNRLIIDDFEQVWPSDINQKGKGPQKNTLDGVNSSTASFEEHILYYSSQNSYPSTGLKKDLHFFEDTVGMKLLWPVTEEQTTAQYRIEIPAGEVQLGNWEHLSLLVANVTIGEETPIFSENQTSMNLGITLKISETPGGSQKLSKTLNSQAFGRIPHPYQREWRCTPDLPTESCTDNQQAVLTGIRIPLSEFGFLKEELNSNYLAEIEIKMEVVGKIEKDADGNRKANIALDEIVFTK